uniref:restriction endonuclease subunit S n=1 Tax=Prevotella sp. TaxID=59823 RepID=UPI003FEDE5FE
MKKSHIDWCPVIPDHWEEKRIKDIAFLQSGNSITAMDIAEEGKYPVYGGNGLRGYTNNYTNDGDYVLIGRQGALCGNINYAYGKFYATEHAVVVYTKNEEITYWLGETLKAANLNRLSMTAAQPGLAVSTLNIQFIPYPPRKERIRIANYLAEKCTEIDTQVSLLTSKRDAYLRLKKSIINHVVTHGLNPNVKMKDSGIEWIGEVPEHWEVKRMKDICDYISRGSTPDYVDEDYQKVMNQGTFSKGWIDESNIRYTKVGKSGAHIKKGDLLMASTGGGVLGKILYFDSIDENYYADSHVTIMRNSKGINSMKFLFYHFSLRFDEINATMTKGSTNQTELQRYELLSHKVAIPPLPEQHAIATYLDDKCAKIDTILSNLNKQISCYGDLKRSLIDEVITGKRAV